MAVHKLILDDVFEEVSFTLIAVHCTLEDFRLAYLLNKYIGINLRRKPSDLDFNSGKSSYSIFEWEDKKQLTTWNLVSNICKIESLQNVNYESLFDNQNQIIKTFYLIPEYKRVNYFLKIDNETNREKFILNTILSIPQIATAYSVNTDQLRSKDNLIFS